MNRLWSIVLFILLLALAGCSEDEWLGFAFPDKGKLLVYRQVGTFKTEQECDAAAMSVLRSLDALETGYYECGKNCKSDSHFNRDCEELKRGNMYK